MSVGSEVMLGISARFTVVVDDISSLGTWASCKGLMVKFSPEKKRSGGNNSNQVWLPGPIEYDNITLTRAVNADDSAKVMTWLKLKVAEYSPSTAAITLHDAKNEKVQTWTLNNVYPFSWSGPELNATQSKVAMETLVLCHEGFL